MSKDIKMFCACNHMVNGQEYQPQKCPRCYGNGFYYDIFFDRAGQSVLAEGNAKLQQEVIKIMNDEKGGNNFHENWGNDVVDRVVGSKNLSNVKSKLELIVRQTLIYLKNLQKGNNATWANMTDDEILNSIESLDIIPVGKTGYQVKVKISNVTGQISSHTISF